MKGFKTSYVGMFRGALDELSPVRIIEIPLIQRDYAQGRDDPVVEVIRNDFLNILVAAISGGTRVDLDFVYGEIEEGTFRPLDGQQRLTTLFLMHWYLAARLEKLDVARAWLQFRYATRPSAELFTRELVDTENAPDGDFEGKCPKEWIRDQPWYLFSWRHDPTVKSMLTMLDAIHSRLRHFTRDQLELGWAALTSPDAEPVIGFYYLPIDDMPSGEDLYIKMNSRGKPLTSWESLKARLEKVMSKALDEDSFTRFIDCLDGIWTDVLWRLEAGDSGVRVDQGFERYLEFVVEICEWRDRAISDGTLLERAERVFTEVSPRASINVQFLFHAFDTWTARGSSGEAVPVDVDAVFAQHFASAAELGTDIGERVLLFEESQSVNLFEQCCRRYGQKNRDARLFTLAQTLALFAILVHRDRPTESVQHRLRILRNLTDTADEVRVERMSELVEGVERLMLDDHIDDAIAWLAGPRSTFSPDRLADERDKLRLIAKNPKLKSPIYALEDHFLLRGRLFPFDLSDVAVARLPDRAATFADVMAVVNWPVVTGALLAKGNYGFRQGNSYQLGTGRPEHGQRWREVLTRYGRKSNQGLVEALALLLDDVASREADARGALEEISLEYVEECQARKSYPWRYYLVNYPIMRSGSKGVYYGEHLAAAGHWDYSMCMVERASSLRAGALYQDPYLSAIRQESGVADDVIVPMFQLGDESAPRWMRLKKSETGMRCLSNGLALEPPQDLTLTDVFNHVCAEHGLVDGVLRIQQIDRDGELVDSEDRVLKGAALVRALVEVGL